MKLTGVVFALALAAVSAFAPSAGFLGRVNAARAPGVARLQATSTADIKLPASVKPGVVTGKALNDLLQYAQDKGFAIPGVNIVGACPLLLRHLEYVCSS